jgi:hypothetical protein
MPWKLHFEEAPKNLNLTVYKELPLGLVIKSDWLRSFKIAGKPTPGGWVSETHCYCNRDCQGWIEGIPNEYKVNTLAPHQLAGRQGTEYYCLRCGEQIAFFGVVS